MELKQFWWERREFIDSRQAEIVDEDGMMLKSFFIPEGHKETTFLLFRQEEISQGGGISSSAFADSHCFGLGDFSKEARNPVFFVWDSESSTLMA